MNSVLLIGAASLAESPYIQNYINILNKNNIQFDFLYWNRKAEATDMNPSNFYSYDEQIDNGLPYWRKFLRMRRYASYVKSFVSACKYKLIVVFTIQNAIFLQKYLVRSYKYQYVFDIRDYSPFCGSRFFKDTILRLIKFSKFNVISSAGFLNWLPSEASEYIVNHNTEISLLDKACDEVSDLRCKKEIKILTIGQLRDAKTNLSLIEAFADKKRYSLLFSGYGNALPVLEQYVKNKNITNVYFTGRYKKEEELSIVNSCDLVNVFLPNNINSNTLMTNRFYNAAICGKPIIVNGKCYQEQVCDKFKLGVAISNQNEIFSSIERYINSFDILKYSEGRNHFLKIVNDDLIAFEQNLVKAYIGNNM